MNKTDFACYVDENTPYVTASNINVVMLLLSLEKGSDKLLQWFFDNQKKANSDKYYFLVNGKVKETVGVTKTEIKKSDCEKLPGIKTDPEHNFSADLNDRISKASRKVNVLSRIKITQEHDSETNINEYFFLITIQLLTTSLDVSEPHNQQQNKAHTRKIPHTNMYNDKTSSFENLLIKERQVCHSAQKKYLDHATKMFDPVKNKFPLIFSGMFQERNTRYHLRKPI